MTGVPAIDSERIRLEECRLVAIELRTDALLAGGRLPFLLAGW